MRGICMYVVCVCKASGLSPQAQDMERERRGWVGGAWLCETSGLYDFGTKKKASRPPLLSPLHAYMYIYIYNTDWRAPRPCCGERRW